MATEGGGKLANIFIGEWCLWQLKVVANWAKYSQARLSGACQDIQDSFGEFYKKILDI